MSLELPLTRVLKVFGFCCFGFITACNPAVYKKPAENFHASATILKQAYFLELDMSNKSEIERADLEDQIAIWSAPAGIASAEVQSVSEKMTKRRQTDIHEELRPLREQAFAALDGYTSTLVGLSSDEPTETIVSELNGLTKDISGVLKKAEEIKGTADIAKKAAAYTGPLKNYVDVLSELIRIASGIIRERAIVKTIERSNDSVLEIMGVLKSEAATARNNVHLELRGAREELQGFMNSPKFANANNAIKAAVAVRVAELNTLEGQLTKNDINEAFNAAAKTQEMLLKKANSDEPTDWVVQIEMFGKQIAAVKAALEKARSEM